MFSSRLLLLQPLDVSVRQSVPVKPRTRLELEISNSTKGR